MQDMIVRTALITEPLFFTLYLSSLCHSKSQKRTLYNSLWFSLQVVCARMCFPNGSISLDSNHFLKQGKTRERRSNFRYFVYKILMLLILTQKYIIIYMEDFFLFFIFGYLKIPKSLFFGYIFLVENLIYRKLRVKSL